MGHGHRPRKVPPNASLHALHVRRRGADIQHGHRRHALMDTLQEYRWDHRRYVHSSARMLLTTSVFSVRAIRAIDGPAKIGDDAAPAKDRIRVV